MALANGYLVNGGVNELDILKLRLNYSRFNIKDVGYTLVPSSACNCICDYCFEGKNTGVMTNNDCIETLKYIEKQIIENKPQRLHVNWYGGEPLLAPEIIKYMGTELLGFSRKYKITYLADIVTNGYLLNEELAKMITNLDINSIQITLDGPEKIHDQRRKLKNGGDMPPLIVPV